MRVVITGATSFIGAAAVRRALLDGHTVCAVVRPGSRNLAHLWEQVPPEVRGRLLVVPLELMQIARLPELQAARAAEARQPEFMVAHVTPEALPGTAAESGGRPELVPAFDAWLHAGWEGAGSENRTRRDVQQQNVMQSLLAMRTAAALGCRRFVFTGSQAEYGVCHEKTEEGHTCNPVSEYGKAKVDFYRQAVKLSAQLGLDYIHTRIFSIYGPGDHPWSLVQSCIRTWKEGGHMLLGECTQMWNFLYIDDAARALCLLLTEGQAGVYNVAGEDTRPLRSYIEELYQLCGLRGRYSYGERPQNAEGPADLIPDITKILSATSWRPAVGFAEGIGRMLEETK